MNVFAGKVIVDTGDQRKTVPCHFASAASRRQPRIVASRYQISDSATVDLLPGNPAEIALTITFPGQRVRCREN